MVHRDERRDLPFGTNAPQQTVSLFDRLVGVGKRRWRDRVWLMER